MVRRTTGRSQNQLRFDQKLVLFQWMLNLFEIDSFDKLTDDLKEPRLEGFDENNISFYYQQMKLRLWDIKELPSDILLAYDNNIVRHWKKITEKRNLEGHVLYPKYFQYLSLLFTEIYLDRYFRDPDKLLNDLNSYVSAFNEGGTIQWQSDGLFSGDIPESSQIKPYTNDDLNKIAFWCATGSGKTLIMHVNILQYRHYLNLYGKVRDLNRVILLTPNEGLSLQHLEEFELSNIKAELFSKDGLGLFSGGAIEVIDIHKLRDESGDKTVAVDAFESNNLVLVDEGHRGTSGAEIGQWMQKRNQLCENGFSFEYSATFGQAMKASSNKNLEQEYARCILFDYSYKYFYADGYGKDYKILNLEDDSDEVVRRRYLTACLMVFYQQKKLYKDRRSDFIPFLIEQPLCVFVGGSVNAVRMQNKRKVSDVTDILLFLSEFMSNRSESIAYIGNLLKGQSGLLDTHESDLFARTFAHLYKSHLTAEQVFDDVLLVLFNASSGASLHVENLKGTDGEIALRLGENDPFGVINVGDTSELCKLCDEYDELVVTEREFSGSLFRELSDSESKINILIGSKKFNEGWNSWRVSTMGMMNIGRSEGSQIIQLFGRGVRLKGLDYCLKRSRRIEGISTPENIEIIETLNIFGIRADYMRQFKEYLEEEGLPSNEGRIEFILPVIKDIRTDKLKTIRVKEGFDFKKCKIDLELIDHFLKDRYRISLDWYPKIQAFSSTRKAEKLETAIKDEGHFTDRHIAFMDIDSVYFELQNFKNERSWYNLNLRKSSILHLLNQPGWYSLYLPKEELEFRSFDQVQRWQEIAITLLKKYCDRYYKFRRSENEPLEYKKLTEDDDNFIENYQFLIEESMGEVVAKLEELKELVVNGQLQDFAFQNIKGFRFHNHLYYPLVYVNSDLVEVKPIVLDPRSGELDFVLELQTFCQKHKGFFDGKEMYLLRNMSRGRGIGFFEAGNFHPDFILWLLVGDRQYITFIDPKGVRNLEGGLNNPKIQFHKTIKDLEIELADPTVTLQSFIISSTRLPEISWWDDGMTKEQFEQHNVLFQKEDKDIYIDRLMVKIISGE